MHSSSGPSLWRFVCTKKPTFGCTAFIKTHLYDVLIINDDHQHYYHGPVFSTSRFGKPLILYNGYRFNQHSSSKGSRGFFVCNKWSWGCRACIKTHDNEIIQITSEHMHVKPNNNI